MKQFNSLIASAVVSGLIVVGMVGIGVDALTAQAAPANNQVMLNSSTALNAGTSVTRQSREHSNRTRSDDTGNDSLIFSQ